MAEAREMARVLDDVQQPACIVGAEDLAEARVHDVAVDQQHRDVLLEPHAEREIQRRERLALPGHGARDHDQVAVRERAPRRVRGHC